MKFKSIIFVFILFMQFACNPKPDTMQYKVTKIPDNTTFNGMWDGAPWEGIDPVILSNYMGSKPTHFPQTKLKVAYDNEAIYVKFKVEDQYVKAVCDKNQGPVYKDSCVEFFFTPETDVSKGYFNLEMNCGGTMLFHHQVVPRKNASVISENDIKQMQVFSSMPKLIEPEINEKITWQVAYRIPFSILEKYHDFSKPQPGTIWRANFYKCADDTTHPHWLTWAPVENPAPDFHKPEYFGVLEFQK